MDIALSIGSFCTLISAGRKEWESKQKFKNNNRMPEAGLVAVVGRGRGGGGARSPQGRGTDPRGPSPPRGAAAAPARDPRAPSHSGSRWIVGDG